MTPKKMKELFGKTKSVPAGNKKTAKTKIQAKKIQQPSSTNAEQTKKYIIRLTQLNKTQKMLRAINSIELLGIQLFILKNLY